MDKVVQRFSRVFIMVLMIMGIPFIFKSSVSAATITVNGLDGSQATITDSSGKTVSNTQGLSEYDYYQVKYNWSIPDSETIKSGDTAQFTLPSNIRVRSTESFNITDSKGQVVGHAEIKAGSSAGTITFTNVPSTFRYNRHGTLTFYVEGKDIPKTDVNSWMINKGGWVNNKTLDSKGNPTQLYWNVVLNPAGKKLTGVSFTDKPQKGQTIIPNSVEVYTVNSNNKLGKKLSPKITTNTDGSMSIDLVNIDSPIYIEYKVNLSKDVSTSGTTKWENVGIMNWNGGSSAHTTALVRHGGSGTEVGYNGSVELQKIDAITKKALSGAVFDLENSSGKVLQSNLTTDSNGKIIVKNLKDGNYQFVEVKAPQGYQINKTPVKFTINDSSSNAVSVKVTAENQPLKSSSSSIKSSSSSKKSLSSSIKSSSGSKKSLSSSIKSSSSSKKSLSSSIKSSSSSKKSSSSSIKSSSSSKKSLSSSIKSSSSSKKSSSSSIKSSSSSKKSSNSSVKSSSSSKKSSSSSIKSSSSSKKNSSSSIKSSSSSKKSLSSSIKSSSSSKKSSSSSIKSLSSSKKLSNSSAKSSNVVSSSSTVKNNGSKSHRGTSGRSKKSSVITANSITAPSSSNNANSTETASKSNTYVSSSEKNNGVESSEVSVEVSSKKATLVSSNIVTPVPGQGSSSHWTWSSKATLVSSTTNVPVTESSVVIISKPATKPSGSNDNSSNETGDQGQGKTSGNGNLPTPVNSSSTNITAVSSPADNANEQPAGKTQGEESSSRMSSSSKVLNAQGAAVKSSSHSGSKKDKNGKILPQTGENEKMMNVLTIVGMVIVVGVVGIKVIKHN